MRLTQVLASTAVSVVLLTLPSLAQTGGAMMMHNCSDQGMKAAHDSMMKMKDATKQAAAMKEMDMAKDMMAKKDETGCKMHMDKAMGMMK